MDGKYFESHHRNLFSLSKKNFGERDKNVMLNYRALCVYQNREDPASYRIKSQFFESQSMLKPHELFGSLSCCALSPFALVDAVGLGCHPPE